MDRWNIVHFYTNNRDAQSRGRMIRRGKAAAKRRKGKIHMSFRPRVLLVAVGGYGMNYLKEMTEKDTGADIAGIVEVMPGIEDMFPVIRERNIPLYKSMEDFYAVDSADLTVISSPIHLHTEMTVCAFRHGSHVLCEKPLCLTMEEAERMEAASREAGKFLAVGYQLNYQRDVWALKEDILAGRFGKPLRMQCVHAMRRGVKYYSRNNWAGKIMVGEREVFDSPFTNACAHNFQMLSFLLGKDMRSACDITGVDAELYRGNPERENFDIAALRFTTDCGVPIMYYTAHPLRTLKLGPIGLMEFENATITYNPEHTSFLARMKDGTKIDYTDRVTEHGIMQKLYDAIECVKHGGTPMCGAEAEYPHIRAVRMVQQQPIRDVNPENCYTEEINGDTFLCVRNLEDIFQNSAAQWKLPGEMGVQL